MNEPKTAAVIGLGLLGKALAERLRSAGYHVRGYDRDPRAGQAADALGVHVLDTPHQAISGTDLVVLCLPESADSKALLETLARESNLAGATILDATTGNPQEMAELGAWCLDRGADYLEMTVASSSEQVRRGEATLLLAGHAATFERRMELWESLGSAAFFLGAWGHAAKMKLVSNLVMGLNRAALAEGLALARKCGLDLARTLEVLRAGNAASRVLDLKGEKMVRGDFSPQGKLAQHRKDVRLILELARDCGARAPLSSAHAALLDEALAQGLGELDNCALIQIFENPRPRP